MPLPTDIHLVSSANRVDLAGSSAARTCTTSAKHQQTNDGKTCAESSLLTTTLVHSCSQSLSSSLKSGGAKTELQPAIVLYHQHLRWLLLVKRCCMWCRNCTSDLSTETMYARAEAFVVSLALSQEAFLQQSLTRLTYRSDISEIFQCPLSGSGVAVNFVIGKLPNLPLQFRR